MIESVLYSPAVFGVVVMAVGPCSIALGVLVHRWGLRGGPLLAVGMFLTLLPYGAILLSLLGYMADHHP